MNSDLMIALFITVVGMTLLFLSLALFYVLLTLMTRLFPERAASHDASRGGLFKRIAAGARRHERQSGETQLAGQANDRIESDGGRQAALQAAAIAVALARAEAEKGAGSTDLFPADEGTSGQQASSWWTLHHQQQLGDTANTRRTR